MVNRNYTQQRSLAMKDQDTKLSTEKEPRNHLRIRTHIRAGLFYSYEPPRLDLTEEDSDLSNPSLDMALNPCG